MIRKLLFILSLFLFISTVYNVDCSDGGTCGRGETCCYKDYLSSCCGYDNAVCCNDGLHCCPSGTTCDLIKLKCVRGNTEFLSENLFEVKRNKPSNKSSSLHITPSERMDLLNGFLEGSDLKKYVPDVSDCAANMTTVYHSINLAVEDFTKDVVSFDDIAHGIQMIGKAIEDISKATLSCKYLPGSLANAIIYLRKIALNPGNWFKLISASATRNTLYIMWDLYSLDSLITAKNYKEVGRKLGEIFKYIFAVDIDSSSVQFFQNESSLEILANKFKKVGKMPSINDIITCVKAVKPLATDIYNAVTSFEKGDSGAGISAIEKALADGASLGFSCYQVINDIISK